MATPTRCPQELVRFPPSSRIAAPATGKPSSSNAARWTPTAVSEVMTAADGAPATEPVTGYLILLLCCPREPRPRGRSPARAARRPGSVLQQVRIVHRGGPAGPEDRGQDGQADDDLRGGHHHHEERDDLPVEVAVHPRERDEGQVDRVQHQLHGHEDDDRVPAGQHAHAADHEEDHRQGDKVGRAYHGAPSCCSVIFAELAPRRGVEGGSSPLGPALLSDGWASPGACGASSCPALSPVSAGPTGSSSIPSSILL